MILLTAAKIPQRLDKNTLADAVEMMFSSPENKKYLEEIRNRENSAASTESLFALALLYEKIRELPNKADTSELIFERNEMGKPYFKNSEIKFNMSHSKGYIACAVSVGEELGVDIEASEISPERAKKLAARYLSKKEQDLVLKNAECFARIWTKKEAKAKFLGKSVGNILNNNKNLQNYEDTDEIVYHSFSIHNIPITLCTERNFSTISFEIQ